MYREGRDNSCFTIDCGADEYDLSEDRILQQAAKDFPLMSATGLDREFTCDRWDNSSNQICEDRYLSI